MPLYPFPGGLRLPAGKDTLPPFAVCPLPERLIVPLGPPGGPAAFCRVAPGQPVRRGTRLADPLDAAGAAVHAPAAGVVAAIGPRVLADPKAPVRCVEILVDGTDARETLPPVESPFDADPAELLQRIRDAGIVGLGGAGFPTAIKAGTPCRHLIVNGAECEPLVQSDDTLMRRQAADVIAGARVLARITGASEVTIALEDRLTAARAALAEALGANTDLRIVTVPSIYPSGGERQLIYSLTGQEVPGGQPATAIGILCQNVATVAAVWRAVRHGEPLTARLVTVAGRGVMRPTVFEVRLGTPFEWVITQAGGYAPDAARLLEGGPMMGIAQPHDAIPVTKTTTAIVVQTTSETAPAMEQPCIRCGECARVCPVRLMPQQLLTAVRREDWAQTQALALRDCIECGCCSHVCPSHIPLVDWYRFGKAELDRRIDTRQRADRSRALFLGRTQRLEREQAERVARVAARKESLAQAAVVVTVETPSAPAAGEPSPAPSTAPRTMDKAAVLAAIARGKARKAANPPRPAPPAPDEDA
ncbi:electron transport complex subunit RsxC [Tahibacter amnicola]|uniref:Ion-translocating oxidoreductase complex subunit C n=1 Tax=Tahibacter amnicola TaxID=2976241 RepID=A0ABY6BDS6_9GAMM|nr:electron transport complex subunit RsxC [Tahibacter amnicola]UXI67265.1 electron transport complex subunit RsxC [Tahibacter amnicola]